MVRLPALRELVHDGHASGAIVEQRAVQVEHDQLRVAVGGFGYAIDHGRKQLGLTVVSESRVSGAGRCVHRFFKAGPPGTELPI